MNVVWCGGGSGTLVGGEGWWSLWWWGCVVGGVCILREELVDLTERSELHRSVLGSANGLADEELSVL